MAPAPAKVQQKRFEDPLDYLPCSKALEYKKGDVIFSRDQACDTLYLVLSGAVKLSRFSAAGKELLVDIYTTDDIIGGSGITGQYFTGEEAVAFQRCRLMSWPGTEVQELIMRKPQLAIALIQIFGRRFIGLLHRAESLSFESIKVRLARTLIRFSERLGTVQADGSVVMSPLTHEVLAHYVSTSRELITVEMANFRKEGYIKYSRQAITLYRDALESWLDDSPLAAREASL